MKILVIGGGGREHALAWKLAGDSCKPEVFCAPGNAGTSGVAVNVDIVAEDIPGLLGWAVSNKPDLTVVGPEAPLCDGITDVFAGKGFRVFGPCKAAARLEGSKLFAKEVMISAGVPTARSQSFTDPVKAREYVSQQSLPIVLKADGLAAGKGVFVCSSMAEVEEAISETMVKKAFGDSGKTLLVEECLIGEEASILALIDGEHILMLASSQDHKRVFNNDEGPNTGGMGAYSPAPVVTDEMWPLIEEQVFGRMLKELKARGIVYKGLLYAGIMVTSSGPKVLEFNCRFGDPETEAILPRIDGDLIPVLEACVDGCLRDDMIKWRDEACVCVVMASGGYPGSYVKGKIIKGLEKAAKVERSVVFHAGTKLDNGAVVTSGGRVLCVSALGSDLKHAVRRAYDVISELSFDQAQYRTDIAAKELRRKA